jgi:hypothetical protein
MNKVNDGERPHGVAAVIHARATAAGIGSLSIITHMIQISSLVHCHTVRT